MSCFELNSYCFTKKKKKKVMHKFLDVWMCKYGITTESNSAKTRLGITFPNSETRCQYP